MAELAADGCKEGGCRFAGWTTGKVGASKEGRGRRQKLNRSLVRVSRTSLSGGKQGGSLASDRRLGGNSGGPSADATGGGDRRRIHSRRRQSISESNLPACLPARLPARLLDTDTARRIASVRSDVRKRTRITWESAVRRNRQKEIRGKADLKIENNSNFHQIEQRKC